MTRSAGVALAAVLLLAPAARADWRLFLPHTLETGAYLDLFGADEKDDNRTGQGGQRWTDRFFKEKLTLFTNGYVYHPRFLLYQLSISEALKQERYEASFLPPLGDKRGSGLEYDTRIVLLPEHAYTLDLFALRYQPLFKEQYATQHNLLETSHGAGFRYRKKPYFFRARYTDQTVETASSTSRVRQLGSGGEYYRLFRNGDSLSLTAGYNPARFTTRSGLSGTSDDASLGNILDLSWLHVQTLLNRNTLDQDQSDGSRFSSNRFSWQELLTASLPWHLRADASYRYLRNEQGLSGTGESGLDLSNLTRDLRFVLEHRLYESLRSAYTFQDSRASSEGASAVTQSHAISFDYTKSVPTGRLLANLGLGRYTTDNRGRAEVIEEPHPGLSVPGTFDLGQSYPDPASLIVILRSPLPPFEAIQLDLGTDYTFEPVGNTLRVTVFALPPQFVVPGSYDLRVSYSLLTGTFRLRTNTLSHGASLQLFHDLLTPYYSYSAMRPTVVSGVLPGAGFDSTTTIGGLLVHLGPLRLRGEVQDQRWEVSPYHARVADLQYVAALGPTTNVSVTGSWVRKDYSRGSAPDSTPPHVETSRSAGANLQQQLFSRRLTLSVGGSWSRIEALLRSEAYSLNAGLSCRVGKLDFSAGGTMYRSRTEGIAALENERTHHYYYAKVRRQIL